MEKTFFTTKDINNSNYMEIGIDENYPVLYVYKDDELFDWHFFGATFAQEMSNLINCYKITHNEEPSMNTIILFRNICKALKDSGIIK